ncbi:hypothetical protein NQ315_010918 [Exocentrus adspersus]|uniref:F-box domain-containing protein n=1 Tax=Exocentrus adspersus TaxID=1586481 RepID=A0AAV8VPJ9_9CUCU|nr:hypothetical protein NQ315_010918 [Exocentrus adspersus]
MSNEMEKIDKNCKFLLLPECVLRVLFSYLDSTTLYQLTKTCRYLQYFITDPIFWRYIDARRHPNTSDKVEYCSDRIHERTTHVFLKAKDKTSGLVPVNFFKTINPFRNLKILALENQRFHGSRLTLKDFPPCLEELSLKGTHIKSSTYFFQHSDQNMQKLRVLILDQCQWVTCSFLMSVTKYENLEIISAIKCLRLHLNMVPYLNVARYGCEKLKVFDCRFTSIGHELLRTFYPKESLQSFYFQSLKSAEVDYKEQMFNQSYMRAESSSRPREGDNSICDYSLFEYVNSTACDIIDKIPDSVLYKDPYPECTCSGNTDESRPPPLDIFDEYYVCTPPRRKSIKFVCQRHVQDVEKLSSHFREFFLSNQHQFYADVKASEVESEAGSSDSESDDNCGTCCMYGMGRSMILLTPGNNPGTIQEEVLELNPDEHEQGGRVVSIFISTPLRESFNNRVSDVEMESDNRINHLQEEQNRVERSQSNDEGSIASTSKGYTSSPINFATSTSSQNSVEAGNDNRTNQVKEESAAARPASTSRTSTNRPPIGESSRHDTSNNTPRTAIITIRNRERSRYVNPLFVQIENKHIKKKSRLRRLSLRGFRRITNLALDYVKNLKLDLIDLTYTSVTKEGIENFLAYNPNCRVIHPLEKRKLSGESLQHLGEACKKEVTRVKVGKQKASKYKMRKKGLSNYALQ